MNKLALYFKKVGRKRILASLAGNILGAYLGEDALPEDWVCELEMTDVIRQQAENMASEIVHW